MEMKKRAKAVFLRPERKLVAILPELCDLRDELQSVDSMEDSLSAIVHFFDVVSEWHDRGLDHVIAALEEANYGQHSAVLEKLQTLQVHFSTAGRNGFGMIRTVVGESVTEDGVFLGNIFGLFTHPVSFWKQRKDERKGGWGFSGMEHLNAYDVVCRQAKRFMESHIGPMVAAIGFLEAASR